MVAAAGSWPPPADESTQWREVVIVDPDADHGRSRARVRPVRLWGREVLIDRDHRVFCDYCLEMIPVDVLGTPGNGHHVSPVSAVRTGAIIPIPDVADDDD